MTTQPDVTLVLDRHDVITGVTVSNAVSGEFVKAWLGMPWIKTVAESGVDKVRLSLEDARLGEPSAYRQIVQRFPSGLELPIEYITVRLGDGAGLMVIGRSQQASSELQSRLIATQQALERDYWKLREVETRYRLLFDASNEAMLVLGAEDLCVLEANPAAIRALGLTQGWAFLDEMADREHEPFRAMLARALEQGRTPGGVFHIGAGQEPWSLRAWSMNDDDAPVYLLQLAPAAPRTAVAPPDEVGATGLLQHMPDGFVVLDGEGLIRSANPAFLDLVQAADESAIIDARLDRWLRPSGVDIERMLAEVRQMGQLRLDAVLQGDRGGMTHVEISAGAEIGDGCGMVGLVLRETSRVAAVANGGAKPRLPPLAAAGKTPLRTLVQAAVEVIERHYVESALRITDGNRTAAAERLGLSRQSLYAKLNRYGMESPAD